MQGASSAAPKGPSRVGLVDPHFAVHFYVLGPRVEAETGQRFQRVGEGFFAGARKNEVNVRDSDVVWPDVDLFHCARYGSGIACELDLRIGRRVTPLPCFCGLAEGTSSSPARRFGGAGDGRGFQRTVCKTSRRGDSRAG